MEQIIMTSLSIDQLRAELIEPLEKEIISLKEDKATPETLLTRKQAAEFLNVTFATLNDWTKRGLIEGGRIGTRVYYKRSNLINAINKFS
tara:strand:- start:574 stop:843 length:270 start_codon:yes stop_codon:yes gene_type:complete